MRLKSIRQLRKKQTRQPEFPEYIETNDTDKLRYITTEYLITATKKLIPQLPAELSGIAGIPRSGMPPAALLAMWLHLPLYEVTKTGIRSIEKGSRGTEIKSHKDGLLLIVDDTVHSGESLQKIKNRTTNCLYAVVFTTPNKRSIVDFFSELLPTPHLLEWNLFNSGILPEWAVDFDGVICEDCPTDGNDTPQTDETYRQWILAAKPKWTPRLVPIPLVITARLEKYRDETILWCHKWGINIDHLVMHPATTFRERNESNIPEWKASVLKKTNYVGYIDSHTYPAIKIHELWGKPTISLQNSEVYQ